MSHDLPADDPTPAAAAITSRIDEATEAAVTALFARLTEAVREWRDAPGTSTAVSEHVMATFSRSEIDAIFGEVAATFGLSEAEDHAMREQVGRRYEAIAEQIGERLTPDEQAEILALIERLEL
jgi:hypothetical protein